MASRIPSDLLYEIFSRLPIKSLFRFRCVSSLWRSIIDDPCLAYMQQTRCAEEPNVLVFHHPGKTTDVIFSPEGRLSEASLRSFSKFVTLKGYNLQCICNGLSCFTKSSHGNESIVVLFNPIRKQVVSLQPTPAAYPSRRPSPTQNGLTYYGLGFDCSKNTYKIVRVFDDESNSTAFHGEVFTLGTNSWRAIPKDPPCRLFGLPVFASGNLHWLAYPSDHDHVDEQGHHHRVGSKIVSFDISKEEFGLIYPPKFRWPGCLLDLNGNLAIVVVDCSMLRPPHIDIWVLKEYERKDQWVKEYDIDLKPARTCFFFNRLAAILELVEFDRVLLLRCPGRLFFCDLKTGRVRQFSIPKLCFGTEALCHKGSILSISGFQKN
ncbi:putative F-box protein At4g38870 [Juglans microcarpa x Juglans regia]|uniref:putative F-box protein At4g38870 n=1 Tax=Juglans microcarpa x Juglans regia TaxID=2249226 RepID=UPI001B7F5848|nr:putative F-box protein At4g38870 [Juglans microcarpa x Juglans regia]